LSVFDAVTQCSSNLNHFQMFQNVSSINQYDTALLNQTVPPIVYVQGSEKAEGYCNVTQFGAEASITFTKSTFALHKVIVVPVTYT